jgi:hypothetical protein
MMGRLKSEQGQLFYQFNLEDAVPDDHLVRQIDTALDLSWLRRELAPHYSSMGRPSIDPELMIPLNSTRWSRRDCNGSDKRSFCSTAVLESTDLRSAVSQVFLRNHRQNYDRAHPALGVEGAARYFAFELDGS